MNTNTIEKTSTDSVEDANRPEAESTRLHSGPIARLLAGVARLGEEHASYKLSKCTWRTISV